MTARVCVKNISHSLITAHEFRHL